MVNQDKIKLAMLSIIEAIGENPLRESIKDTPQRVAEMYAELFSGLDADPKKELVVDFEEGYEEMVILRDISFYSMCEHHLLPFYGTVHIGYLPNADGRVVGLSKLARVAEIIASRPQIQERMTTQIADSIMEGLKPSGVAVVVQAVHLCMVMRGVKKPGSNIVTSAIRGAFIGHPEIRMEFLSLLHGK